jgi:ribosomal protein S18 acetylase RimI-like enzyme
MALNSSDRRDSIVVTPAEFPRDLAAVKSLFHAYAESLDTDLAYQNFADEVSMLPGKYAPAAGGALLLAFGDSQNQGTADATDTTCLAGGQSQKLLGCACLRALSESRCELKRLYVVPSARGLGVGKQLLQTMVRIAEESGYIDMVLDTLPSMVVARGMYQAFGFEECDRYYDSPIEGTSFLRLHLRSSSTSHKRCQ